MALLPESGFALDCGQTPTRISSTPAIAIRLRSPLLVFLEWTLPLIAKPSYSGQACWVFSEWLAVLRGSTTPLVSHRPWSCSWGLPLISSHPTLYLSITKVSRKSNFSHSSSSSEPSSNRSTSLKTSGIGKPRTHALSTCRVVRRSSSITSLSLDTCTSSSLTLAMGPFPRGWRGVCLQQLFGFGNHLLSLIPCVLGQIVFMPRLHQCPEVLTGCFKSVPSFAAPNLLSENGAGRPHEAVDRFFILCDGQLTCFLPR